MHEIAPHQPEFSRLVSIAKLESGPLIYKIMANAAECAALAERFGLPALHGFTAEIRLAREIGGIRLNATINADLDQICSVTLEPFRSTLTDAATLLLRRDLPPPDMIDPAAEEEDDLLVGEEIDIGEAVAQQLSLALDPFPRAPGAASPILESLAGERRDAYKREAHEAEPHPFAVLAGLAKKERAKK